MAVIKVTIEDTEASWSDLAHDIIVGLNSQGVYNVLVEPMPTREFLVTQIALAFEGYGPAWWNDGSGDLLAGVAADVVLRPTA